MSNIGKRQFDRSPSSGASRGITPKRSRVSSLLAGDDEDLDESQEGQGIVENTETPVIMGSTTLQTNPGALQTPLFEQLQTLDLPRIPSNRRPVAILSANAVIADPITNIRYQIVKQLGSGQFAFNYKAVSSETLGAVTLKRFYYNPEATAAYRTRHEQDPKAVTGLFSSAGEMEVDAKLEFAVSQVIKKRSQSLLCANDVVCARRMFKITDNEIYIEFPYVEAVNLDQYMRKVLYPAAHEVTLQRDYVMNCLKIARDILLIVGRLGAIRVAHSDIKPSNVLIEIADNNIRLIDFGLGCNFPDIVEPGQRPDQAELFTACPYAYDTTINYKDPLAESINLTATNAVDMYAKFAVYSCGIIVQRLFDDQSSDAMVPIPIRKTTLMPMYVYALIKSMTSHAITERLSAFEYGFRFEEALERFSAETPI